MKANLETVFMVEGTLNSKFSKPWLEVDVLYSRKGAELAAASLEAESVCSGIAAQYTVVEFRRVKQ